MKEREAYEVLSERLSKGYCGTRIEEEATLTALDALNMRTGDTPVGTRQSYQHAHHIGKCPSCNAHIREKTDTFCHKCGKKIKWVKYTNKQEGEKK